MAGQGDVAVEAANNTAAQVNRELKREPGLGALQHYLVTPLFALVRFGRWDAILAEPAPPSDLAYPTGVWHYARALAFVAKDSIVGAEKELGALDATRTAAGIADMKIWELNGAADILRIAREAVAGEIAAKRGDHAAAIAHLEQARDIEDGLTYDEPPTWHLPARQQLGAVLLDAGRPADAEAAYRQDLRRHPENGWSLFGLAESLRAQGKAGEANAVMARFDAAWADADATLAASRF
jgi:tetratricopeptide (TPR) repeat protein